MVYVPNDVPSVLAALQAFMEHVNPENEIVQHEALQNHYEAAISELRYAPEVQLLELAAAALGDNSTRLEILQPFRALCFILLKTSQVEIPSELKAAERVDEDETADQNDGKQKRSCQRPTENNCRGMCGKGCSCWHDGTHRISTVSTPYKSLYKLYSIPNIPRFNPYRDSSL